MIISRCPKEHILSAASAVGISVTYCEAKSRTGLLHLVKLRPSYDKAFKVQAGEHTVYKVNAAMRVKLTTILATITDMTPNEFLTARTHDRIDHEHTLPMPEPLALQAEKMAKLIRGDTRPKYKKIARYQRRSISNRDRAVAAVCWHGFRDFFMELFKLCPTARCRTAYANYNGSEGFEALYPETAYKNIGSSYYPLNAEDACWCEEG